MREPVTVECRHLAKSYGETRAVDDVSFVLRPGRITAFLGANGAGKSSTLQLMTGALHGAGDTTYAGRPLLGHPDPGRVVGVHLGGSSALPGRTARAHLEVLAARRGVPAGRVEEVLALVGLGAHAGSRPRGFSTGMRQALGLATAVLLEPTVLLLDEVMNGLDVAAVARVRDLLVGYARDGGTVLMSTHLLVEAQAVADDVLVIDHGRLVVHQSVADFLLSAGPVDEVVVASDRPGELAAALEARGYRVLPAAGSADRLVVRGAGPRDVAQVAAAAGVLPYELQARAIGLEEAFLGRLAPAGGTR